MIIQGNARETMKATKRPWRVFNRSGIFSIIAGKSDKQIIHWAGFDSSYFPKQNEANAALIVEAVNAHDSLLARNKKLRKALEWIAIVEIESITQAKHLAEVARAALAEDKDQTHDEAR